jgi:ectoine hydroxylase-related dioxygenase (phytanoyl-CoA dioxygenase family)
MVNTELGHVENLTAGDVPHAAGIEKNVPLYDMAALRPALEDPARRRALLAEWGRVFRSSAGVIALKRAYPDTSVIDRASEVFRAIIAEERESAAGKGDHFAAAGANDRIWNSLQKQCLRDPEGFALYFGNTCLAAAAQAWLGPNYQMTAQVNQVRPGGKAQTAHRDYHLGFMSAEEAMRYPAHAHEVTATLTLQGAVAHVDMSVESGPTKLLPFSQLYGPGYVAFHDAAFRDHFEQAHVQVPLDKGDAVFFNPALFHAGGENRSPDVERMVNLLQLIRIKQGGGMRPEELDAAIAACAEGYPFPTNLDTDPPVGGLAPPSMADLMRRAVQEGWTTARFAQTLADQQARQAA